MSNDTLPVNLIQTFLTFVESANVTETAGRLGISQPAVSVHLKKFEKLTPFPVFSMEGKRKVLSHYGTSLYEALAPVYRQLFQNIEKVNSNFGDSSNLRLIVAGPEATFGIFAAKLEFSGTLSFQNKNSREAIEDVLSGKVDIAISHFIPENSQLHGCRVFSDSFAICAHKNLVTQESDWWQSPEWLQSHPFVAFEEPSTLLFHWFKFLNSQAKARYSYVVPNWSVLQGLVDSGFGYSILPEFYVPKNENIHSKSIPEGALPLRTYYAVYRPSLDQIGFVEKLFGKGDRAL